MQEQEQEDGQPEHSGPSFDERAELRNPSPGFPVCVFFSPRWPRCFSASCLRQPQPEVIRAALLCASPCLLHAGAHRP